MGIKTHSLFIFTKQIDIILKMGSKTSKLTRSSNQPGPGLNLDNLADASPASRLLEARAFIPRPSQSATLETLSQFVKELNKSKQNPEIIAIKYLQLYNKDIKFIINSKDVKSFLPNINIKSTRLLSLFGVTPAGARHARDPKEILYFFNPHQYILATMINSVSYANFDDRIDFAFKMYDQDDDGKISKEDLRQMLLISDQESQLKLDENMIEELIRAIFQLVGKSQDGFLTYDEFYTFFQNYHAKSIKVDIFERRKATRPTLSLFKTSEIQSGGGGRSKPQREAGDTPKFFLTESLDISEKLVETRKPKKKSRCWMARFKNRFYVDRAKWIWLFIWACGALYFFISTLVEYYTRTGMLSAGIAKGSAAVINYNMAIMFALVTKTITTLLRATKVTSLLPLNFNIYFHMVLGITTFFATLSHIVAHMGFFLRDLSEMPDLESLNNLLLTPLSKVEPYTWWVFVSVPGWTGIAAFLIMVFVLIFARKKVRRNNYELFWYSHMLWVVLVTILAIHGMKRYLGTPKFYFWVGGPSFVLIAEFILGALVHLSKKYQIVDLKYLESEVIELKVSKPRNFRYIPGQYARIKIPQISLFQWHPFSFSSCYQEETLNFHISPVGDWTNQLKSLALAHQNNEQLGPLPKIYLTGPYGAPSQHYSNYKHLMIISTGVGATPFASILRDLSLKVKEDMEIGTELVEFYWINKKPSSHVWLSDLLKELQEEKKEFIKVKMYLTSPQQKYDIRSLLVWKGLEVLNMEGVRLKGMENFDIIHWGRPDWNEIFQRKCKRVKKGVVGVFFCGNNVLAKELHEVCVRFSGSVKFEFCKEIF